ncbi:SRPBCC domain-containing protein [Bowmanella dokdonensis]|uniref:SRPBCC domain-containing protein n=1 Tax=Bowmanella dokdonensis TaxID=751969 RepID=A0A939DPW2_9ALTE|nr:SRPBCC domain-containing protein [Bowmanella dokdonensis]MBN7826773.1 SRPBCC domain-containing protein [Bowmanella dokdonensis]
MSDIDSISRQLEFNQSIEQVWQAISDPAKVSQWFGSRADYQLAEGSEGWFEWPEEVCSGRFAMRIERVEPNRFLAWRWMQDKDVPFAAEQSTLVEWSLEQTDGGTRLTLKESGFLNHHQRKMNVQGWHQELNDLYACLADMAA